MKIESFTVKPKIPEKLLPLQEMAYNLWTSWNYEAQNLFIRLDYDSWIKSEQNPVKLLAQVSQSRLEKMANDDSYLAALDRVYHNFQKYLADDRWYQGSYDNLVAYFSMEYGLDVSLPIYSGGLGVLSGDHMKTASDLCLPVVGVGLLYRQGYFRQYLNQDGYQQEYYPEYDWYNMPVKLCLDKKNDPRKISVQMGDSLVFAQIWEVKVGKVSIYLLDTNVRENNDIDRKLTSSLYAGDRDTRIRQEILLGIGGIRALRKLGIYPAVTHMNEGHSAFLALERIRQLMEEEKLSFDEAFQVCWATNIFTTHTPVPAGNESFAIELVEKYLRNFIHDLGISWTDFMALGRDNPKHAQDPFCLTTFALKSSAYNNGVSKLHGVISRKMWQNIWYKLPEPEIPISHITNGVHPKTWLSPSMADLFDKYFGPRFTEEPSNLELWQRIDRISDEELWRNHERRREELVAYTRERIKKQLMRAEREDLARANADEMLSPYKLTISFARRFATYKRANLLMRDPERLIRLLSDKERPIQIIFAGKAHPLDGPGKDIIKEIYHFSQDPRVKGKILFIEDYDMTLAKYLTSGSDIWLNNPRRPLEASGTSGMKAAMNGVMNLSILDGWWDEAYSSDSGWAIGRGEEYDDHRLQDEIESKALYDLLEREVIPLFYNRGRDNLPRGWIHMMKNCIKRNGEQFSSNRMLLEYSNKYYLPALENFANLKANNYEKARNLTSYLHRLKSTWKNIRVLQIWADKDTLLTAGDTLTVKAQVNLDTLKPDDVVVQLYYGTLNSQGEINDAQTIDMVTLKKLETDAWEYQAEIQCNRTGRNGFSVRVLPEHADLIHFFIPGMIKWVKNP
ncbi:MAG: alpha-glucan family phosphorylase [Spirochaetales bacterium]|nr:alpha-glucan family phosphorylase [Spirochaetales bacterium]